MVSIVRCTIKDIDIIIIIITRKYLETAYVWQRVIGSVYKETSHPDYYIG